MAVRVRTETKHHRRVIFHLKRKVNELNALAISGVVLVFDDIQTERERERKKMSLSNRAGKQAAWIRPHVHR